MPVRGEAAEPQLREERRRAAADAPAPNGDEGRQQPPGGEPRPAKRRAKHLRDVVTPPRPGLDLLGQLPHHPLDEKPRRVVLVLERYALRSREMALQEGGLHPAQADRIANVGKLYDRAERRGAKRSDLGAVFHRHAAAIPEFRRKLHVAGRDPGRSCGLHRDREREIAFGAIDEQSHAGAHAAPRKHEVRHAGEAVRHEGVPTPLKPRDEIRVEPVTDGVERLEVGTHAPPLGQPHHDRAEPIGKKQDRQPEPEGFHDVSRRLPGGAGAGGRGRGGSTRASAFKSCPSAALPSGASLSTTANRRLRSGSRMACAANCRVSGMNQADCRAPAPALATAAYCSKRARRKAPFDGNCRYMAPFVNPAASATSSSVASSIPRSAKTARPAPRSMALVSALRFCRMIPISIYDTL